MFASHSLHKDLSVLVNEDVGLSLLSVDSSLHGGYERGSGLDLVEYLGQHFIIVFNLYK